MPIGTFTRSFISHKAAVIYRGATPFNPNKFYLGLANTNTLNRGSSIADFIAAELLPSYGYARKQILFSGDGAYNTLYERHELPDVTLPFAASGGSLQFQTAFLLANATPTSSRSFTDANVDAATNKIAIANHGLVNSDEVIFTAAPTATLPGGIFASTLYKVANATTNDFSLTTVSGTPVDITNTGSGTFYCRYASGIIAALFVEPSQIQILDGSTHSYRVPIAELNTGYVSGV